MFVFLAAQTQEKQTSGQIVPFEQVEKAPVFPGCEENDRDCSFNKLVDFFRSNFKEEVLSTNSDTLKIDIRFILDTSGNLKWQRISTNTPEAEAEAARVLKLFPKIQPGIQNGENVSVMFHLPMLFELKKPESYPLSDVEVPPLVKSCINKEDKKKCLSEFIQNFVLRNFRASNLGQGHYETKISFTINTSGRVENIKVKGANEKVNTEAIRVIEKLPLFIPAKNNGKNIAVNYQLPIYGMVNRP